MVCLIDVLLLSYSSEVALLYNDRAVLENHHVSAAFRLMKEDDNNILSSLKKEEYRSLSIASQDPPYSMPHYYSWQDVFLIAFDGLFLFVFRDFRSLVIDIVLATDMSYHFQQIKNMKNLLSMPEK